MKRKGELQLFRNKNTKERREFWMKRGNIKKRIRSFFIIVIGFSLMFYPWISNYMNDRMEDSTISAYHEEIKDLGEKKTESF